MGGPMKTRYEMKRVKMTGEDEGTKACEIDQMKELGAGRGYRVGLGTRSKAGHARRSKSWCDEISNVLMQRKQR